MKKLIFFLQIFILSPFWIFIILIYPFIKIKICWLKTRHIGDYFIPLDIFLLEKKFLKFKKNEIFLWYYHKPIANEFFFNRLKKKIYILPGYILQPIQEFFQKFKYTHKFIFYKVSKNEKKKTLVIPNNYQDKEDLLFKSKSQIVLSKEEEKTGYEFLEKNGIFKNDKIISFSSRTGLFRDENFTALRNGNINNQIDGIDFLIQNGYKAVRLGRDYVKFDLESKVFDYSKLNIKNDMLEFFIVSKSKFMICTDSGINALPVVMRIPRLIVNFVHFKNIHMSDNKFTPIILPKKVLLKKNNELLPYRKIFQNKILDHDVQEKVPEEYQILENSSEDILNSVKEMYNLYDKNILDFNKEKNKQIKFWDMVEEYYGYKHGYKPRNLIISPSFYEKNFNLFF